VQFCEKIVTDWHLQVFYFGQDSCRR